MAGRRTPGPIGFEPGLLDGDASPRAPGAGFDIPGPIMADTMPTVKEVVKDWEPPQLNTTPQITVKGRTLADLLTQLNARDEWGLGGGSLRSEALKNVTSPEVTVRLHANLVFALPTWNGYAAAKPKAKAEWDRMVAKLRLHEQRHVDIAIEEANRLAQDLVGKRIDRIAGLVTNANSEMMKRQQELDKITDHGSKPGVLYGDVFLDTTIE